MRRNINVAFIFLVVFMLFLFASCQNALISKNNKLEMNFSLTHSLFSRNASLIYPLKIECILFDVNTEAEIEQKTQTINEMFEDVSFSFYDLVVGQKIKIVVNIYNDNDELLYTGFEELVIESGSNNAEFVLSKVQSIIYEYLDGSSDNVNLDAIDVARIKELPKTINPRTSVYAWESFDGSNYHYFFGNQELPLFLSDTGSISLKQKELTLGDVVLSNHQIIPEAEELGTRTPIGVLASLQNLDSDLIVPLRVLSYKIEEGLAWIKDEDVPGYNVHCPEPSEEFSERPIEGTGKYYFEYFQQILEQNNKSFDLNDYPIFKRASEMNDGELEWFIPHGWEIQGASQVEIMDNAGYNKLNIGLGKIIQAGYSSAEIGGSESYWSSTLPKDSDSDDVLARTVNFSAQWGWKSFDKTSTSPKTIFMAILD